MRRKLREGGANMLKYDQIRAMVTALTILYNDVNAFQMIMQHNATY